jgi:hypothetical protein
VQTGRGVAVGLGGGRAGLHANGVPGSHINHIRLSESSVARVQPRPPSSPALALIAANAAHPKWILKNRAVVPLLLLTGVFGRYVVPELLSWQPHRDYVGVAEGR